MLLVFMLLLLIVPAIEIAIFIWAGGEIGVWSVLGLIVLTAVLGSLIVRHEGLETLRRAQMAMERMEFPAEELLDGILILIGAVLLITPGFFTDALGFLIVFPLTRPPFKKWLKYIIKRKIDNGSIIFRRW